MAPSKAQLTCLLVVRLFESLYLHLVLWVQSVLCQQQRLCPRKWLRNAGAWTSAVSQLAPQQGPRGGEGGHVHGVTVYEAQLLPVTGMALSREKKVPVPPATIQQRGRLPRWVCVGIGITFLALL